MKLTTQTYAAYLLAEDAPNFFSPATRSFYGATWVVGYAAQRQDGHKAIAFVERHTIPVERLVLFFYDTETHTVHPMGAYSPRETRWARQAARHLVRKWAEEAP